MPQVPGTVKLRVAPALSGGPPRGPLGLRVSTTRHGAAGMKRNLVVLVLVVKLAVTDEAASMVRQLAAFSAVPLHDTKSLSAAGDAIRQTLNPAGYTPPGDTGLIEIVPELGGDTAVVNSKVESSPVGP